MLKKKNSINKTIESLSPNERKIIPYMDENLENICKKSNLDKTSVLRSLEYLKNKKIINLDIQKKKFIDLDFNGAMYKKKELPERKLLNLLNQHKILEIKDAKKLSNLTDNEFKASLGVLKSKAIIELKNGKLILNAGPEEISKKTLEEALIEKLPIEQDNLADEQKFALKNLQKRKNIIQLTEKKTYKINLTNFGKEIINHLSKTKQTELIEIITPELLASEKNWKGKKFRRYDLTSPIPKIYGGKRHFVNQAIDYARQIWTELGFEEMTGPEIQQGFWNFDALFTAQDHPVREMHDTFFLNINQELPEKQIVKSVKETHEKGVDNSKGWQYSWKEEPAKKLLLRTHTTCLSAKKLYELSKLPEKKRNGKFFSIGKCFRNETIDWSHGFEFYQTEGIVVDENVNFQHLLGYLKQFYKKMGFEKIKFAPAYFPYTEPSVEVSVWHPEKRVWLELGGAGIFRPEITLPLLGKKIPVLAWGQGFDRIIMDYYKIKDLRELYKNNLTQLRNIKYWVKN